jgi:hypothetical protein
MLPLSLLEDSPPIKVTDYRELDSTDKDSVILLIGPNRKFPQAMGSPRTTRMDFTSPNQVPCIPTFHVMNARGEMADKTREAPDVSDEQVLTWYKNMVTGT